MRLEDFKDWRNPKYIETCNKIIKEGLAHVDIHCERECPFMGLNSTNGLRCHEQYRSNLINCGQYKDDKLVQSAEQFLELVELQKRVESKTTKDVIEESEYMKFSKIISNVMNPTNFTEKDEEYIILDQNNYICSEVNTLKLAEEFVNNSLQKDSNNTFIIYKKVKTGKAKVNVETEWEE